VPPPTRLYEYDNIDIFDNNNAPGIGPSTRRRRRRRRSGSGRAETPETRATMHTYNTTDILV